MGTKYSSNSISGYNSSPPSDDGAVSENNKVKWSTIKTKVTDPIKTLAEDINTALVTHFNRGPTIVSTATTLGATHYNQIIEASGTSEITLTDATTLTAGWFCDIINSGVGTIPIQRATASDTIDGTSADTTIVSGESIRVVVNDAATGFLLSRSTLLDVNDYNAGQVPSANADATGFVGWAPAGHINGLVLSNDTDTDHDINVTAGEAADSGNTSVLKLTSEITKQIDATWASGDDAGGLSSSLTAPENDTTYYVFLVEIGGSVDVLFDTSITCANGATDHSVTNYRLIGSILTDGSANIINFVQNGTGNEREYLYKTAILDVSTNNPGTSAVTPSLSIPTGKKLEALIRVGVLSSSTTTNMLISPPDETDAVPSNTASPLNTIYIRSTDVRIYTPIRVRTNTSKQIRYRFAVSDATITVYIVTHGYREFL